MRQISKDQDRRQRVTLIRVLILAIVVYGSLAYSGVISFIHA